MAQKNFNTIILLKNGTTEKIAASSYVPQKGEPVVDIAAKKLYVGNGSSAMNALTAFNITREEVELLIANMVKTTDLATAEKAGIVKVDGTEIVANAGVISVGKISADKIDGAIASDTAEKLAQAMKLTMTGDVSYEVSFDGSEDVSAVATLASVGTAGTYTKVTTDAKGRVVSGAALEEADIPTLGVAKISGLGALATKDEVAVADLAADVIERFEAVEALGADAIKAGKVSGNTVSFYTAKDATGTAAFSFDFPEEFVLDQAKTVFVDSFAWSEELYPGSTNPSLDGKPVLVLAVKGDGETAVSYSFVNVEKLIDVYTGKNGETVAVTVTGTEIAAEVKISAEAGNQIVKKTDGIYVATTDISGKMDLVAGATNGNVAILNANGQAVDSGMTLGKSVPADAVFTDTTYELATAEANGLMSAADYSKLAGIAAGAEVNVNADWNATSGDAQILNKPTAVSAFTNDANYVSYAEGTDTFVIDGGEIA